MTTDNQNLPMYVAVISDVGAMRSESSGIGYTTLRLVGELDLAGVTILGTSLQERSTTGHLCLRLDLAELTFCDAAGLGALLEWHRRFAEAGGVLLLANVRPNIARIMRLTKVDTVLRIAG